MQPEKYKKLHRSLALLGLACLILAVAFFFYDGDKYERSRFNHGIFSRTVFYITCLVVGLYFILNYNWYRLKMKTALFISFLVIALANTVLLCAYLVDVIKGLTEKNQPGKLNSLAEWKNPPPKWLVFVNDTLPVVVMLLITICFLLLLPFRKKWTAMRVTGGTHSNTIP